MLVYRQTNILVLLGSFTIAGFLFRIFVADFGLESDNIIYYKYAASIAFEGRYPDVETPLHNLGWVFLLVPLFKIVGPNNEILFFLQHMLSIIISTATIPVSYLFARKFIGTRYAVFVPFLFAIDFRMAQNAGFGVTEPFVMLISLAAYSVKNRILMFVFVGVACLVRFEAIMLIPVLFVIHKDRKMIPYIAIPICMILLLFMTNSMLDHPDQFVSKTTHEIDVIKAVMKDTKNDAEYWTGKIANSLLYMIWAAFPIFVFSIYGITKHRWLIVVLAILSISGIYAYLDAYDTRYFFPMYPFLALASAYSFERIFKSTT